MANELLLDVYVNPALVGTGGVSTYAIVFDKSSQALLLASTTYGLTAFTKTNQNSHAIPLTEHAERTCYHAAAIPCENIDMPISPYGEEYLVEYWLHPSTGGTYDRDTDTLLETRKFSWTGTRVAQSRLDLVQEQSIANLAAVAFPLSATQYTNSLAGTWGKFFADLSTAVGAITPLTLTEIENSNSYGCSGGLTLAQALCEIFTKTSSRAPSQYVAHLSMSYDSSLRRVYYTAWLEKDGVVVTDPQQCAVTWIDRSGNTLAQVVRTTTYLNAAGCFYWTQDGLDLEADLATFATVSITDVAGEAHSSGMSPVTWD